MSKRKSLRIGGTIVHLMLAAAWLSFYDCGVAAADYSFYLDRFEISGQVSESDEFNDGSVSPWVIYDPVVEESGGFVSFSSPGTIEEGVLDGFYYSAEMSFIGSGHQSPFVVENGAGDFTGVSRWAPIIPGVNQWYEMQVGYEVQQDPHKSIDISVGVANWDSEFAGIMGIDPGLGISFYLSGDSFIWQHILIDASNITGDIFLSLDFDDNTDQFTAGFSLDGGANYQYFPDLIGWDQPTPGHYEWYFSGQAILELQPIGTLSGWIWMVGDSDFGYSLDENDLVYFLSFGPVWSYNFTTGLWVEERPVGWIYVDWPFYYVFDTDSLMFALPPESGLWVYHFRPGEWTVLPRILP